MVVVKAGDVWWPTRFKKLVSHGSPYKVDGIAARYSHLLATNGYHGNFLSHHVIDGKIQCLTGWDSQTEYVNVTMIIN